MHQQSLFNQKSFVAQLDDVRKKYYLNKAGPRKNPVLSVAVHVRRGDVSSGTFAEYYTSNGLIRNTLLLVAAILDKKNMEYKVAVYSQGSAADFQQLALPGVEFFINADVDWTLSELIEADVLLLAKGYFSRYAALVSDGIKLCDSKFPNDVLEPLDGWITRDEDGSFDRKAFEQQLEIMKAGRVESASSPSR